MQTKKKSLKDYFLSSSLKINLIIGLLIWGIGFYIGILLYDKPLTEEVNIKTQDVFNYTTWYYFKKNIIVYNIIILSFITLSILSFLILLFNGLIIGYFFVSHIEVTGGILESLLLFLPHFSEIIGLIIGYHLSIYLVKKIFINKNNLKDILTEKRIIYHYLFGTFLILIGAITEANITILFI